MLDPINPVMPSGKFLITVCDAVRVQIVVQLAVEFQQGIPGSAVEAKRREAGTIAQHRRQHAVVLRLEASQKLPARKPVPCGAAAVAGYPWM